ncbi:uncharacterized protein BXZ73DRAFT_96495 [Epithele typhae]|uniref:uncharacterized protein n=1 Tax=Epithele typhae TaxID=378194 RepID=UPI00200771D8|nr:uncharacterized protein BXZ73DRAFT_96495 [Epithele typhae]KAH9943982.1 hypothetical protein BXZ73DRAFT_96495 [Epithele typhae]
MPRYTVQLNNYLQKQGQLAALHWGEEFVNKEWKLTAYLNQETAGVGVSAQKGAAKELASKEALQALGQPV